MTKSELRKKYLDSAIKYRELRDKAGKNVLLVSLSRLIVFLGGVFLIWAGFIKGALTGIVTALIITGIFLWLLKLFSRLSNKHDFLDNLVTINENEADALVGKSGAFDPGKEFVDARHDFSFDVDLFGESSLFQYLNRTVTGYGRKILAGWLSDPCSVSGQMGKRQDAIRELAGKDSWRHEFMASGMISPIEEEDIKGIIQWLDEKETINISPLKRTVNILLPVLSLVFLILWISGITSYIIFVELVLLNLIYVASGLKKTNRIHKVLSKKYTFLSSMNSLLLSFEKESFTAEILKDIRSNISGENVSAAVSVKKLGRLIESFDSRNNMMVGFALNGLFLWDYQCISRLEKWKSANRQLFPVWLRMLGEIDAYNSLANFAFNNQLYSYPSVATGPDIINAHDLGHPLIDEAKRVCNDFSLGEAGNICIITGANMAGKSTFLRTVAVNLILGMSGAPVCATYMAFRPSGIFTSMRTVDSLSDNESYFYAEIRRLSKLKSRVECGEKLFFILDEILKGTNSEDKSTGSKLFLARLLEKGGTGLIATHDTSLAELEMNHEGVVNKCFEIEIEGENIHFDYKLREGITKRMNAVFLMKQMGILD